MKGRRLPVVADDTFTMPEEPGDYSGPVDIGDGRQAVYFLLPIADPTVSDPGARSLYSVQSPPHTFRECPDGSLEIRASIGAYGSDASKGYVWHGYLDKGHVWREC